MTGSCCSAYMMCFQPDIILLNESLLDNDDVWSCFLVYIVGGFFFAQRTELPEDPAQIRQSAVQHHNKGEKQ